MAKLEVNWKQIVVTALITGAVAVATGLIVLNLQQKEPRLVYDRIDSLPFQGDKTSSVIYNVRIRNEGRKSIRNVVSIIGAPNGEISQYRIQAQPALDHSEIAQKKELRVQIPMLNPHEEASISLLVVGSGSLALKPAVSLRGDDFTGTEATPNTNSPSNIEIILSALAAVLAAFVTSLSLRRLLKSRTLSAIGDRDVSRHSEDQRRTLSYLLGIRGLISRSEEYLRSSGEMNYWSESDYLAASAIASGNTVLLEQNRQLLLDVLEYVAVAKSSEGIIYSNLAKIAACLGKAEEAVSYLMSAKTRIPQLLATRIGLDPLLAAIKAS